MRVLVAENAGACYGVLRALDMANSASKSNEPTYTLGPLIHNPQVVSKLEANGVFAVSSLKAAKKGTVVIRSHGVTPAVRASLEASGLKVVDATCPHVARAQKAAASLGEMCGCVVVVGEAGHPEVEGIVACAKQSNASVYVAANASELPSELPVQVGVVVQTTQTQAALENVVGAIEARGITPHVKNTICSATKKRQQAALELAKKVDVMVVIGGKNSANTTHLAEICASTCKRVIHIETAAELRHAQFEGFRTFGVTAGASTPDAQIQEVVSALKQQ